MFIFLAKVRIKPGNFECNMRVSAKTPKDISTFAVTDGECSSKKIILFLY